MYVNSPEEKMKNGVLSLTHLARLKCINNAHLINDIGITPYHLIEPVLMKKTAKSLKQMESNSPQIIADSEPLWKSLLKRDFPDRPENQIILNNGKKMNISSRNLYDKYVKEREQQRLNATNNLKQITRNLNEIKNKNKVKTLNKILPTNKSKMVYKSQPVFKSSLLQKARVVNKQRVRNFTNNNNSKNKVVDTNLGLVKISSNISTPQKFNNISNNRIGTKLGNNNNYRRNIVKSTDKKRIDLSNPGSNDNNKRKRIEDKRSNDINEKQQVTKKSKSDYYVKNL